MLNKRALHAGLKLPDAHHVGIHPDQPVLRQRSVLCHHRFSLPSKLWQSLSGLADASQGIANRYFRVCCRDNLQQDTSRGRIQFIIHFVGLELHDWLALFDLAAFFFEPAHHARFGRRDAARFRNSQNRNDVVPPDPARNFLSLGLAAAFQCTSRSTPIQYGFRMVFLSVLAAGVFGISCQNSTDLGDFTPPSRALQCAMIASSFNDSPFRKTTMAFTASPHFSSGTPITAHSLTSGNSITQASTSPQYTLKPPVMIMSFLRSTM